jgi:replication factor C large subunit
MLWTEKYRPKNLEEIVGNEEAKRQLVEWIINWYKGGVGEDGCLLTGPPGIGKTTAVYALANQFNLHVIELNASDYRTAQKIYEKVGYVGRSYTLDTYSGRDKKNILLFFDEIDGIDPKADTGGLNAVLDIASRREVPVIAAANVPDPASHKELLKSFRVIQFRPLTPRQIIILLKRIALLEKLSIDEDIFRKIAEICRGDARLAVNMLQESALGLEPESLAAPMENLPFDVLMERLSGSISINEIKTLLNSNSRLMEDVFYTYFDMILKSGINFDDKRRLLSECVKLNILFGRINKKRHFILFKYLNTMLSYLIYSANRAGVVYDGKIPLYRLRYFVINRSLREELHSVYDTYLRGRLHCSYRKFITEVFPLLCSYVEFDESKYPNISKLCRSAR